MAPEVRPRSPPAPAPQAAVVPPIDPAWRGALAAWVRSRQRYPEAARRLGTEGTATLRFSVSREGQVLDAQLVQTSGSDILDDAALAMVRGARGPAFPPGMAQPQVTVSVSVHYRLQD